MDLSAIIGLIISFFSLAVSCLALIFSRRKYELTHAERESMLAWSSEIIDCLKYLEYHIQSGISFDLTNSCAKLSSLIDRGRFYFPNNYDGRGSKKPSAYCGKRDMALDVLVWYLNICMSSEAKFKIAHLRYLENLFVSRVFDVQNPREYNKHVNQSTYLNCTFDDNAYHRFLASDPSKNDYVLN